jgi:hypothetical protein
MNISDQFAGNNAGIMVLIRIGISWVHQTIGRKNRKGLMSKRKIFIVAAVLAALIALRLALPTVVRDQANKKLKTLPGYSAHIDHVHLGLLRGAAVLEDISIKQNAGNADIHIDAVSVAISWHDLLRKTLVCDVRIVNPGVDAVVEKPAEAPKKVKEKTEKAVNTVHEKTGQPIPAALASLFPFRVNRLELTGGEISLREITHGQQRPAHGQQVISNLNVTMTNLTNSGKASNSPFATIHITGRLTNAGKIDMGLHVNPTAERPTFDATIVVEKFDLKSAETLLEWQTGLRFKSGTFALYAQASAKDGGFSGHVKPFVENLEVDAPQGQNKFILKVKKVVVNAASKIFRNDDTKNVATDIPFSGRFENPNADLWTAIGELLRNAFIEALKPSLDPGIKIRAE